MSIQHSNAVIGFAAAPLLAIFAAGLATPAHAAASTERNFDGFAIGAQAGWEERRIDATVLPDTIDAVLADRSDGVVVGGYIGYDHQFDGIVIGVETGFSPNGRTLNADLPGGSIELDSKWSADFSVRIGATLTPRLLAYGRIGYGLNRYRIRGYVDGQTDPAASSSETADGVIFGGGLELALNPDFSVRAEYRRKEFDGSLSSDQVLGGVTFHF